MSIDARIIILLFVRSTFVIYVLWLRALRVCQFPRLSPNHVEDAFASEVLPCSLLTFAIKLCYFTDKIRES